MKIKLLLTVIWLFYSFACFAQTDSNKADTAAVIIADNSGSPIVQVNSTAEYLEKLDGVLNTELAATLAGLSLAALAFLFPFVYPIKERILKLNIELLEKTGDNYREGIKEEIGLNNKRLSNTNDMIGHIYWSFIFFLLFLLETLTIDVTAEKDSLLSDLPYVISEVGASGILLLIGIIHMWSGAKKIRNILGSQLS